MNYAVDIVREHIKNNLSDEWEAEYSTFNKLSTSDYIHSVGACRENGHMMCPVIFAICLNVETNVFERCLMEVRDSSEVKDMEKTTIAYMMGLHYPEIFVATTVGAMIEIASATIGGHKALDSREKEIVEDSEGRLIVFHKENIMGLCETKIVQLEYKMSVGEEGMGLDDIGLKEIKEIGDGGNKIPIAESGIHADFSYLYRKLSTVRSVTSESSNAELMETLVKYDILK